ncbi:MAG TPA: high-potential iron-sulfur protein [Burkholderiales bacterium]|nr:high-potential iron-sulfur protein [Burkholderiales bacterium]
MDDDKKISRRSFLKGAMFLAAGTAIPLAAFSRNALADAKVSKAAMHYQDTPNGSAHCSTCIQYIPGSGGGNGTCKVVAGSISPNGWCLAYAPK